jgi:hypothetical protein
MLLVIIGLFAKLMWRSNRRAFLFRLLRLFLSLVVKDLEVFEGALESEPLSEESLELSCPTTLIVLAGSAIMGFVSS